MFSKTFISDDDVAVARKLKRNKLRILCFVLTRPANHKIKAATVKATWAKHFSAGSVLFMSSIEGRSDYFIINDSAYIFV